MSKRGRKNDNYGTDVTSLIPAAPAPSSARSASFGQPSAPAPSPSIPPLPSRSAIPQQQPSSVSSDREDNFARRAASFFPGFRPEDRDLITLRQMHLSCLVDPKQQVYGQQLQAFVNVAAREVATELGRASRQVQVSEAQTQARAAELTRYLSFLQEGLQALAGLEQVEQHQIDRHSLVSRLLQLEQSLVKLHARLATAVEAAKAYLISTISDTLQEYDHVKTRLHNLTESFLAIPVTQRELYHAWFGPPFQRTKEIAVPKFFELFGLRRDDIEQKIAAAHQSLDALLHPPQTISGPLKSLVPPSTTTAAVALKLPSLEEAQATIEQTELQLASNRKIVTLEPADTIVQATMQDFLDPLRRTQVSILDPTTWIREEQERGKLLKNVQMCLDGKLTPTEEAYIGIEQEYAFLLSSVNTKWMADFEQVVKRAYDRSNTPSDIKPILGGQLDLIKELKKIAAGTPVLPKEETDLQNQVDEAARLDEELQALRRHLKAQRQPTPAEQKQASELDAKFQQARLRVLQKQQELERRQTATKLAQTRQWSDKVSRLSVVPPELSLANFLKVSVREFYDQDKMRDARAKAEEAMSVRLRRQLREEYVSMADRMRNELQTIIYTAWDEVKSSHADYELRSENVLIRQAREARLPSATSAALAKVQSEFALSRLSDPKIVEKLRESRYEGIQKDLIRAAVEASLATPLSQMDTLKQFPTPNSQRQDLRDQLFPGLQNDFVQLVLQVEPLKRDRVFELALLICREWPARYLVRRVRQARWLGSKNPLLREPEFQSRLQAADEEIYMFLKEPRAPFERKLFGLVFMKWLRAPHRNIHDLSVLADRVQTDHLRLGYPLYSSLIVLNAMDLLSEDFESKVRPICNDYLQLLSRLFSLSTAPYGLTPQRLEQNLFPEAIFQKAYGLPSAQRYSEPGASLTILTKRTAAEMEEPKQRAKLEEPKQVAELEERQRLAERERLAESERKQVAERERLAELERKQVAERERLAELERKKREDMHARIRRAEEKAADLDRQLASLPIPNPKDTPIAFPSAVSVAFIAAVPPSGPRLVESPDVVSPSRPSLFSRLRASSGVSSAFAATDDSKKPVDGFSMDVQRDFHRRPRQIASPARSDTSEMFSWK